jgi:PAS domain S-box-containing protein
VVTDDKPAGGLKHAETGLSGPTVVKHEGRQDQVPDERAAILRTAIDRFADHAFLTLNRNGMITLWNVGSERLFGLTRDRALGLHVSALFTPEDRQAGIPMQRLQQADQLGLVSGAQWFAHEDGKTRDLNVTIVSVHTDSECSGYAMLAYLNPRTAGDEDIRRTCTILTARLEETTRQLSESNALLATEIADRRQAEAARIRLLRRLVMTQEEERRRIARDLHDDLGQRLTALRLTIEALGQEGRTDSTTIAAALGMISRIDEGLDFLSWELRPAALDELGLPRVLDNYVHEWSRHAGVPAAFHTTARDQERFAPEVEASVYRIAQEALNNVAKHARARSVNVLLEQRDGNLVVVIEDDGVGVPAVVGSERMIGLAGMRERAAAVGGTVEIEPTPDGGTTVLARIPIVMPFRTGSVHDEAFDAEGTMSGSLPNGLTAPASDSTGVVLSSIRTRLQELQRGVSARDEFIATVAHELRNPIAPLVFQVRLAIDKSERLASAGQVLPPEWVPSQLRRIEQRLHQLLETLDRLLDVSRLSTGRIDLQPEPVNLGSAVRDVISTFEAELAVARCKLMFSEQGDASGVWDRVRLEQICRNLLSNAIRFGAGAPIEVSVACHEDCATLRVRDQGIGISPDQHTRIFERFERGVNQRSGGFGIGLWVVKNTCLAMGGTISVESTLGEGATFTVTLPRGCPPEVAKLGPGGR